MFTGIITEVGEIVAVEINKDGWLRLSVHAPNTASFVREGSSVAVSGVCLTVVTCTSETMLFSILPETLSKTVIGSWSVGTRVNLENALRVGDELGGHMVYGHVDGVVCITDIVQEGASVRMRVQIPRELQKFCVPKGSVTLDGVSLTIAQMGDATFDVALIDYTLAHTTLGDKKIGDMMHIECDMMLKFFASQGVFAQN